MTGLFLLFVVVCWLGLVLLALVWIARRLPANKLRPLAVVVCAGVLVPLPVADELVSAPAFNRLCEDVAKPKFDPEKIRGKTIYLVGSPTPNPRLEVGLLNGYSMPWRYLDVSTNEELISENSYFIKGGIFIRTLGISETNAPLIIRSHCGAKEHVTQASFLNRHNLNFVERREGK